MIYATHPEQERKDTAAGKKMQDKNDTELSVLNAFYPDSANNIAGSSMNRDICFDGAESVLFSKLFKKKNEMLIPKENKHKKYAEVAF